MDLWIRSQDKQHIIKAYNIWTGEEGVIYCNLYESIKLEDLNYLIIGNYKTKERALEVLDEIQNMLYVNIKYENEPYYSADIKVKTEIVCNMAKVYQMPID